MKTQLSTLALLVSFVAPAWADTNLVQNGSFEDGTTGWTDLGRINTLSIQTASPGRTAAEGSHWGALSCTAGGPGCRYGQFYTTTITQQLATTAGANYTLSFSLGRDVNLLAANGVIAYWNGVEVLANINSGADGSWAVSSIGNLIGTGSDELAFSNTDGTYGFVWLDAVSVSTPVPEPATAGLLLAGLLAGLSRRRRPARHAPGAPTSAPTAAAA